MMNSSLEARDLRLVQAIAEAGGATNAGRQLHLSQSAVSHQLRGLEERLGLALFERHGKRLHITRAGQKLVELAHQVLQPLLQAELELKRGLYPEKQQLRVATQCYTAYHWLPRALQALQVAHPEVELALHSEVIGDAHEQLSEREVDVVLCVTPPRTGPFTRVHLFDDELVLVVPRGHALGRKKFVTGEDLAPETLIQTPINSTERDRVTRLVFGGPARVNKVLRVPAIEAVMDLVQAGLGVSILARFAASARQARGDLELVRLTRRGVERKWTGVFPRKATLEAPIRTLLSTLQRRGTS
jgi:LysR family transcriptional regulator, regulator for metE and metH